jgi:hypothetical protein
MVHGIAKKSHSLPSASWRLRKAAGTVPVEPQRPKNQKHQYLRTVGDGCSSSADKLTLPLSFCFLQALNTLDDVYYNGESDLYSACWFKYKKCPQTHPEIMFYHLCGHPLAQSSRLIKLANKVLEQLKQRVLCT